MKNIEGMLEAFKESKQVFLTTTSKDGVKSTRPMTNYNKSPYEPIWFPSFKGTQKIMDVTENPEVVVSFPSEEENKWFRVYGSARLAPWDEVKESWVWWYLEWVPEKDRNKYELHYDDPFIDRSIIWIDPVKSEISDSK